MRFLESAATTVAKQAIFIISSPTVENGIERQKHTVTYSLRCPASACPEPNTLVVKHYITDGYDTLLRYNDAGNVTFAQQATGYNHSPYGAVTIRMASDNSDSTVNFCSRTLNLRVNYVVSAGTFGHATDTFVGK